MACCLLSLVISAGQSELEQLKKLIAKIDIRRAQVLVEAIIVDLSESAAQKLGVEAAYQSANSQDIPISISRFNDPGTPDLLSIIGSNADDTNQTLALSSVSSLLNTQGLISGFGNYEEGGDNFIGILNTIASDADSNIYATPSHPSLYEINLFREVRARFVLFSSFSDGNYFQLNLMVCNDTFILSVGMKLTLFNFIFNRLKSYSSS